MDQTARNPEIRSDSSVAASRSPVDPDALPPSPARRTQLLFILIILPVVAVMLPAIVSTYFFGQKPKVKPKPLVGDVTGLSDALQRSANSLLPTPSTLTGEPVKLTCRPERLEARAERIIKQAASFGGTANEWLAPAGEKHFYVELPAGCGEAFRQSLSGDAPVATPGPAAAPMTGTASAKDQVEVFIRANNDE
jgi:hypothetical protein